MKHAHVLTDQASALTHTPDTHGNAHAGEFLATNSDSREAAVAFRSVWFGSATSPKLTIRKISLHHSQTREHGGRAVAGLEPMHMSRTLGTVATAVTMRLIALVQTQPTQPSSLSKQGRGAITQLLQSGIRPYLFCSPIMGMLDTRASLDLVRSATCCDRRILSAFSRSTCTARWVIKSASRQGLQ